MEKSCNNKSWMGIGFIIAGLALILYKLNVIPYEVSYYIFRWQMILIGIGLLILLTNRNKTGGIIMIGIGSLLYFPDVFHFNYELRRLFWPSILVVVGIALLFKQKRIRREFTGCHSKSKKKSNDNFVDELVIFSGGGRQITSQSLEGGKVFATFGGTELNLLNATPATRPCVFDIAAIFGGVNFVVPKDWTVKIELVSIFGGFSDKRHIDAQPAENNNVIVIKGFVLFGGGEIRSKRSRH
jgi:predicted membrane protein